MAIVPDTKNWTWVLERQCPDCGFFAGDVSFRDIPALIRADVDAWADVLSSPHVAQRPNEQTWSRLEYGAHVRDVHRKFLTRLDLVRTEDDPLFENWDQDATAIEDDYNAQDPATVAVELADAARALADAFDAVPDADLSRTGRRSDGARFTIRTLAQYYIHDPVHHLWDVRR